MERNHDNVDSPFLGTPPTPLQRLNSRPTRSLADELADIGEADQHHSLDEFAELLNATPKVDQYSRPARARGPRPLQRMLPYAQDQGYNVTRPLRIGSSSRRPSPPTNLADEEAALWDVYHKSIKNPPPKRFEEPIFVPKMVMTSDLDDRFEAQLEGHGYAEDDLAGMNPARPNKSMFFASRAEVERRQPTSPSDSPTHLDEGLTHTGNTLEQELMSAHGQENNRSLENSPRYPEGEVDEVDVEIEGGVHQFAFDPTNGTIVTVNAEVLARHDGRPIIFNLNVAEGSSVHFHNCNGNRTLR